MGIALALLFPQAAVFSAARVKDATKFHTAIPASAKTQDNPGFRFVLLPGNPTRRLA